MTEIEFMRHLRSDAARLLERAELITQLLPESVRELAMSERLYTLRSMLWQYDQAIAKADHCGGP
jgi:hypothetical protein